ncbi:hypothetical protein LI90_597 [Carbonactinospora thermoautotrophica]|uniref:Uncharacterized protein n=1 Tax=Carbonactinospora thermoautotrophica TaxID=1469144 RepID=A0A132MM78_9ACTN|nr:hypothetical protein LI90_597 [Carbonactinospora thermoautotrophica]
MPLRPGDVVSVAVAEHPPVSVRRTDAPGHPGADQEETRV